jgi:hypothetical protein
MRTVAQRFGVPHGESVFLKILTFFQRKSVFLPIVIYFSNGIRINNFIKKQLVYQYIYPRKAKAMLRSIACIHQLLYIVCSSAQMEILVPLTRSSRGRGGNVLQRLPLLAWKIT